MSPFRFVLMVVAAIIPDRSYSTRTDSTDPKEPHIVVGRPARLGQFPFIVSIISKGEHCCGGSIITPRWVVTAGHCIPLLSRTSKIEVGMIKKNSGRVYSIMRWIQHESFTGEKDETNYLKNDIGLVKVKGTIKFNKNVRPIKLGHPRVGDLCAVAGWGATEKNTYPENLLFTEVKTLKLKECREFEDFVSVGIGQVCSLDPLGKSPCSGDSGGPLVFKNVLVGIVSYGYKPCTDYYPEVYTSPAAFSCWISNHTGLSATQLLAKF